MKRCFFLMGIFMSILISLSSLASAESIERPGSVIFTKYMNIIEGDWYDNSGNKVLSIHQDKINGCSVLYIKDLVGGSGEAAGHYYIQEDTGMRELHLSWHITGNKNDAISLNDIQVLHRSPSDYYYESIHGIHLGMSSVLVKQKLGSPDFIDNRNQRSAWHYKYAKMVICFDAGGVDSIRLYSGSPYHLEQSGLNCENTDSQFVDFYKGKMYTPFNNTKAMSIGNGEYLFFKHNGYSWLNSSPSEIELTFYSN